LLRAVCLAIPALTALLGSGIALTLTISRPVEDPYMGELRTIAPEAIGVRG